MTHLLEEKKHYQRNAVALTYTPKIVPTSFALRGGCDATFGCANRKSSELSWKHKHITSHVGTIVANTQYKKK